MQLNLTGKDGQTCLYIACFNGHADVVRVLLSMNSIDTEKDVQGWTPLMIAQGKGHTQIVNLLIRQSLFKACQQVTWPLSKLYWKKMM